MVSGTPLTWCELSMSSLLVCFFKCFLFHGDICTPEYVCVFPVCTVFMEARRRHWSLELELEAVCKLIHCGCCKMNLGRL